MESQLGVKGRTKRTMRRTSSLALECGPASQGLETCISCSLSGAFFTGSHIRDCIVAVHASGGCLFMVTSALGAHMKFWPKAVCSSLHETDIVFGGQGPLEELITKAEEVFDPKIIMVATGCVADIMADNVKDITAETQKRLKKAKAISVSSGGFLGDTFVGYEKALLSIIDQLVLPSWETSEQAKTGELSVNVLGMIPGFDLFWEDNIKELKRIFGLLGIKVLNVLTGDCSLETLYALPSAHLNVVISDCTGVEAAKHLEESLAMPYVVAEGGAPIGVDPTVDLFRQVAKFFGIENRAEEVFEQEKRWVYQAICRGKDVHLLHTYGGLEFAVVADSGVALGMTRFLKDEMGLIPTYIGIANRNLQAPQSFARFMGEEMANIVEVEADGYHVREALLRTKPRIVFGRHDDKSTCREIGSTYIGISFPLYDRIPIAERPLMGFAGAVNIFDEMINLYAREQI